MMGIVSPPDGETTEQFVAQRLALSDSRKTTVLDLLGVHLERVFREFKTFLDESCKLADTATLFTQNFLGVSGTDDDLRIVNLYANSKGNFDVLRYGRELHGHRNQSNLPRRVRG